MNWNRGINSNRPSTSRTKSTLLLVAMALGIFAVSNAAISSEKPGISASRSPRIVANTSAVSIIN